VIRRTSHRVTVAEVNRDNRLVCSCAPTPLVTGPAVADCEHLAGRTDQILDWHPACFPGLPDDHQSVAMQAMVVLLDHATLLVAAVYPKFLQPVLQCREHP
jgi:hypothetical protein